MSSSLHETLLNRCIRAVAYGLPRTMVASEIESDTRKRKKAVRELIESGYVKLSDLEGYYEITNKVWDELKSEPVTLSDLWNGSRKDWNKEGKHPLIRFNFLTEGQKKFVLENPDLYKWYVYESATFKWGGSDHIAVGPKSITDTSSVGVVVRKMVETLETEKRRRDSRYVFIDSEVCISSDSLEEYVRETLEREKFETLYGQNLLWYLQKTGILTSTERVIQSDEPDWIHGSKANLGKNPEDWESRLQESIQDTKNRLATLAQQLKTLEEIEKGVSDQGGWESLKEGYKVALRKAIEEKQS